MPRYDPSRRHLERVPQVAPPGGGIELRLRRGDVPGQRKHGAGADGLRADLTADVLRLDPRTRFDLLARVSELELEIVVQMVTDAGVELTGARFGAYFHNIMDETGERLHLFAEEEASGSFRLRTVLTLARSCPGQASRRGSPPSTGTT